MAISNPATENPTLTKYKEFVTDRINNHIVYGENASPAPTLLPSLYGSTTAGITSIPDLKDSPITAQDIYNALLKDVNQYTRVRKINFTRIVQGPGGNISLPAKSPAAIAVALLNRNFACDWQIACTTDANSARTGDVVFTSNVAREAFKVTHNVYGPTVDDDGSPLTHEFLQHYCAIATVKYSTELRRAARVNTAVTASGFAILHHKYGFEIDSSDVANPITQNDLLTDEKLEELFQNFYDAWFSVANLGSGISISESVCHSSCHTSCHSARGRR